MTNGGRMGLTQRQSDCLTAIKGFAAAGRSPSLHEIAVKMGLNPKSKSAVYVHLVGLKERGYIDWLPNKARSIFLVGVTPTQADTTAAIARDYEMRAALGLNEKTAFSCMPDRARDLVTALRQVVDGKVPPAKALADARRVLAGGPL